jgi:hypothetical protein
MITVDEAKLREFIDRRLGDLGGAYSVALVRIGAALGLCTALRNGDPATSNELARSTGLAERYLREWLAQQAASGYLCYDPQSGRFALHRSKRQSCRREQPVPHDGCVRHCRSAARQHPQFLKERQRPGPVVVGHPAAAAELHCDRPFQPFPKLLQVVDIVSSHREPVREVEEHAAEPSLPASIRRWKG